jgi:molybdenum cofactor cytidylyltransferase
VKFGPVAAPEAAGAILAHSLRVGGTTIRKGTVITAEHVAALRAARVSEVIVARLDDHDVHEDRAAADVVAGIAGKHVRAELPFTGRSNLFSVVGGLVRVDKEGVDRLNRVDPAVTIATLPDYAPIAAGQMVATVKIIPFALPRATLDRLALSPMVAVAPFKPHRVGLVATTLPSLKPSVMDKTRRLFDERLAPSGSSVMAEARVPHEAAAVAAALAEQAKAGADLLVVFGASAVVDVADVVPAAIVGAGGRVVRIGMPVDPGNLLVLGVIGGIPVIGAPGCARSPKENGFDWVLNRILAGLPMSSDDIASLGVGGLLMEIPTRPQPREAHPARVAALLLAAGSSRRMGATNKLVAEVDGKPLVRIAAEAALGSRAAPLIVVTGNDQARVESALAGLDVRFAHNPDHARGMSTSLRAGIANLPEETDAVVILLADMPHVTSAVIDRLIAAFHHRGIVVPTDHGRRGNPVVWPRRFFPQLMEVEGDVGGRRLIEANASAVTEVEVGPAASLDVDTPEVMAAVGGKPA